MKTSIVINTYNRAPQLRDCFEALKDLRGDFEVIVVNGPSTDGTRELCEEYKEFIVYLDCKERNLSISRNIGIANSLGDIVAFIDDDAVVHPLWLSKLLEKYTDDNVLAVGGFTIDNTGKKYQATATLCDRLGEAHTVCSSIPTESFCFPGSPLFPSLLGTNSSFRADALRKIGGFDETFAYFLDETDVCLRLIDIGGKIVYAPDAHIYHRYAPSHLRNTNKVPTTLFVQSKSKVYYMFRHGTDVVGEAAVSAAVENYRIGLRKDNRWLKEHNYLSASSEALLNQDVELGIQEGRQLARSKAPTNLEARAQEANSARNYKQFKATEKFKLRVALITQGYPPQDTSGIARWSEHVARGLVARGNTVHVITKCDGSETVDFVNGIWIHKINPVPTEEMADYCNQFDVPKHLSDWSAAAYEEAQKIGFENLDIISAPIWDVEGLVSLMLSPVPVCTSLHTTYGLAYPYKPDWHRPLYDIHHVQKVIAAERYIFDNCDNLLANTSAIVSEISSMYDVDISSKSTVVAHGVDRPAIAEFPSLEKTVLFVGRQESRKGFDTALMAALKVCAQLPDVKFRFIGARTADQKCSAALNVFYTQPEEVKKRISIEGYVTDEALIAAYSSCEIFLAPSRFESFGLVAIEAMRFGKPVVAGKVGGLVEVVDNMKDGILVDPEDSEEMSRVLIMLLMDSALSLKLGENAKESYEQKFTTEKMVAGIEDAYFGFVGKRHRNDIQ